MHMGVGLVRCKYDADAWQARAGQVLLEVADGLERYIRTYAETFEDDRSLGNRAITCAIRMIAAMVPTLKDNGFSAEREWRLIALPIDEHTPRLVEFRSRMPHGLVSYINLPLAEGDNNLDLTRVNIGPAQINSAPQRAANARRETALLLRKYRHQASLAHDSALTFWA
jgi:hypothetical protein